jgi:type VI secretion system protein ImpE
VTDARALYREGRLNDAIQALGAEVRDHPTDAQRRTFLFELLCFAGEYDRAEKQLRILEQGGKEAEMGALILHSALHAERLRRDMFEQGTFPTGAAPRPAAGTLNGTRVDSIADADPRIGARLELFAAGQYTWIPFDQIASVRAEAPKRLRDLLWLPAKIRTAENFQGMELGEVLIPVLAPLSARESDDAVRLGRVTEWYALEGGGEAPVGQKTLLVDGEELPILELRELEITPAAAT